MNASFDQFLQDLERLWYSYNMMCDTSSRQDDWRGHAVWAMAANNVAKALIEVRAKKANYAQLASALSLVEKKKNK